MRFQGGKFPENFNSIKVNVVDMWQFLTAKCVISGKPFHIAISSLYNRSAVLRGGGICYFKIILDKIKNGRLAAIIDFNMSNI